MNTVRLAAVVIRCLLAICFWGGVAWHALGDVRNALAQPRPGGGAARQAPRNRGERPLIVVNFKNIECLLNHAVLAYEEAGHAELAESMNEWLANYNDLRGLDRKRPAGICIYFSGLVPEPVYYLPVNKVEELLKTLETCGLKQVRQAGEQQYELKGDGESTIILHVREKYAFLGLSPNALDRDFGDPQMFSQRLSANYDVAAAVFLSSISETTRSILTGTIRAQAESGLQRRDHESEAGFRLRKAIGMQRFDLIEKLITQGEQLTVGCSVSDTEKFAAWEVVALAKPGSELAEMFGELKGTQSHFANLLNEKAPWCAGVSFKLNKEGRKVWTEILASWEITLDRVLKIKSPVSDEVRAAVIRRFLAPLQGTIDKGRLNAMAQILRTKNGKFAFVGGVRIHDAAALAAPVQEMIQQLEQAKVPVQISSFTHRGIVFHKTPWYSSNSDPDIFGGTPSLHVGSGAGALWISVGGEESVGELKRLLDRQAEPVTAPPSLPLQITVNFAEWMNLLEPENGTTSRLQLRENVPPGQDLIRADLQGLEHGARFRLRFDQGFIRLFGAGLVAAWEDSHPRDEINKTPAKPAETPATSPETKK